MKNLAICALLISGLMVSVQSCKKADNTEEEVFEQNYLVVPNTTLCGYEQYDLTAGSRTNTIIVGGVEIANDANNLYIEITPTDPRYTDYKLFVGNCDIVRSDTGSAPNIFQFPLQGTFYNDSVLVTIPLNTLDPCFCVVALLSQPRGDGGGAPGTGGAGNGNGTIIDYCEIPCPTCNTNNVFGQGGWGSKPAGQNPGTYLHANFATWFPSGVTLGCASGYTLKLNTAQNVTNFLPQGGTPRALNQSYVNPTNRITVFAGHLLTLVLNVASNPSLGNQTITNGPFAGLTVNQFLVQANNYFGGCSTGDANKFSSTAASISSNPSQNVSCD
jgi:hypothetical protein